MVTLYSVRNAPELEQLMYLFRSCIKRAEVGWLVGFSINLTGGQLWYYNKNMWLKKKISPYTIVINNEELTFN